MNAKAAKHFEEQKQNSEQTEDIEDCSEETGAEADGFDWGEQLEVGHGGGGVSKYNWDEYPEPKDGKFPTKTYTGLKSAKVIYASIKKFRAKLAEDKKEDREFVVKVNRDGKGKDAPIRDIKVQRIK